MRRQVIIGWYMPVDGGWELFGTAGGDDVQTEYLDDGFDWITDANIPCDDGKEGVLIFEPYTTFTWVAGNKSIRVLIYADKILVPVGAQDDEFTIEPNWKVQMAV